MDKVKFQGGPTPGECWIEVNGEKLRRVQKATVELDAESGAQVFIKCLPPAEGTVDAELVYVNDIEFYDDCGLWTMRVNGITVWKGVPRFPDDLGMLVSKIPGVASVSHKTFPGDEADLTPLRCEACRHWIMEGEKYQAWADGVYTHVRCPRDG